MSIISAITFIAMKQLSPSFRIKMTFGQRHLMRIGLFTLTDKSLHDDALFTEIKRPLQVSQLIFWTRAILARDSTKRTDRRDALLPQLLRWHDFERSYQHCC
jgi:hypothetical protein